jgi:hypothetical protein
MASATRWRHEVDVPGGIAVKIVDGPLWWSYAPGLHAFSNESAPVAFPRQPDDSPAPELLNPHPLIDSLAFIETRTDTYLGRLVEVVRAAAKGEPHQLLPKGADGYEFVIDRERDVALRIAATADGVEFSTIEVTELEFDVPHTPEVFRVDLPAGMTFVRPPSPEPRRTLMQRVLGKLHIASR